MSSRLERPVASGNRDNFALMVYGVGGFTHGSTAGPFPAGKYTCANCLGLGFIDGYLNPYL